MAMAYLFCLLIAQLALPSHCKRIVKTRSTLGLVNTVEDVVKGGGNADGQPMPGMADAIKEGPGGMGGGMPGGGGGGDDMELFRRRYFGDTAAIWRRYEDPNDPGSAAARQALGAAQTQGLSQGQSLVAAAEAYERATGKPMPGAPSGAELQAAKQFHNEQVADQKASQDRVAEQTANQARGPRVTSVHLYWEGATKCDLLNSQPAPSLSGEAQIMTDYGYGEAQIKLSTGAADRQTTRTVESSTSPVWKEYMKFNIVDFDNVNPKLSLSLKQTKYNYNLADLKKYNLAELNHLTKIMFTQYNLVDLKKFKADHGGECSSYSHPCWLKVGVDLSVASSSSNLAQKADLRVRITFS